MKHDWELKILCRQCGHVIQIIEGTSSLPMIISHLSTTMYTTNNHNCPCGSREVRIKMVIND